jgi:hypothetical protein
MNTYYVIWEILTALTGPQKIKLWNALHTFGEQSDAQPYRITHGRARGDGQAVLLVLTVPGDTTKADFISALAAELGISAATLNANSNFTKLAGGTTEQRAESARQFITANAASWGEL